MAKKIRKKVYEYTAIFEPAEEGGYVVYVPALPGCVTQGENFEEAFQMIQDAIAGYLAVLKETKGEIPKEKPGAIIARVPAVLR
ncbi:MAG: type II toxin-antitoxin system HicB family antitoxin [candidate division WOR-3 bacterium]